MIISASRRTDVPAFYGDWLMNRIKEGYFYRVNPFNPSQIKRFSLLQEDVDLIVFWTKNPQKMLKYLEQLNQLKYKYYFQYTLNDYPKLFEPQLPSLEERINTFIELSNKIGISKVIWRYDPIIISDITTRDYHIERFKYICDSLKDYTKRVIISFVDMYGKVNNRFKKLEKDNNFKIYDITLYSYRDEFINFAKELNDIATAYGLEIFTCSEKINLENTGINHGSCIDVNLINKIFNLGLKSKKDKNQRAECLCNEAVDVGMYNSCLHECSYCYANLSSNVIIRNRSKHDINSPILIGQYNEIESEDNALNSEVKNHEQLRIDGA